MFTYYYLSFGWQGVIQLIYTANQDDGRLFGIAALELIYSLHRLLVVSPGQ